MRRIFGLFVILVGLIFQLHSQTLPAWTMQLPKPGNNTYMYVCEYAISESENSARNQAMIRVFQSTAMRIGQPVSSDAIFEATQKGENFEVISQEFNIPINKVCEYSERLKNGMFRVFVLCQVATAGNITPIWESYEGCQNVKQYKNGVALVESMFIPGLGQMSKRRFGSGTLTLLGEVTLVSAGFGCYFISREMLNIMKTPNISYEQFSNAQKSYNMLRTAHYIAWGAAATLYVYNLFRAYYMNPKYKTSYSIYPGIQPEQNHQSYGIILNLKF